MTRIVLHLHQSLGSLFGRLLDTSCLWELDSMFGLLPYKLSIPKSTTVRSKIIDEMKSTCERRALGLFRALTYLLPAPLFAIYMTATIDSSLLLLIIARFLVDGGIHHVLSRPWGRGEKQQSEGSSPLSGSSMSTNVTRDSDEWNGVWRDSLTDKSHLSANGLVLLGFLIHAFQFLNFLTNPTLISSPYGFCSNIFLFLVTGFTSYALWFTAVLCLVKNFLISAIYYMLPMGLTQAELDYFYAYWCSCAIVLVVITPVHMETIARVIAEGRATIYKSHMNNLLRASFDAYVWVDDDLRVVTAEPRLDCIFMRPMYRRSLLEFLTDADFHRLKAYLAGTDRQQATTLFHSAFQRGPFTDPLHADLYVTTRMSDWFGHGGRHLVGIKTTPMGVSTTKPVSSQISNFEESTHERSVSMHEVIDGDAATDGDEDELGSQTINMMESVSNRECNDDENGWECPECHCTNFAEMNEDGTPAPKICALCGAFAR